MNIQKGIEDSIYPKIVLHLFMFNWRLNLFRRKTVTEINFTREDYCKAHCNSYAVKSFKRREKQNAIQRTQKSKSDFQKNY